MKTLARLELLALLALSTVTVVAGVGVFGTMACGRPSSEHLTQKSDGQPCGPEGDASCVSGHCSNGFCCQGGNCCGTASDCPASFHSAPTCTDAGAGTTCQGTRQDAACQSSICAAVTVDDDSACNGSARGCAPYRPVACTSALDQPAATCLTSCTTSDDCAGGFACNTSTSQCVPVAGTGNACAGTGQGTCDAGLKCGNGICCGAGVGGDCCTADAQCANGLACDTATSHACYTTCTDNDSSRCASSGAYCSGNACVPKVAQGAACTSAAQCTSANCAQGVCCNTACTGACQSCNDPSIPASKGTCSPVADDARCGTISCAGLNGQCRVFNDVTTNRCSSGACKPPNDTSTCTSYRDDNALCGSCQKCGGGTCVNQLATEDLKNECPAGSCVTGTCNGAGACGMTASGTGCSDGNACTFLDRCDGAGHCAGTPYSCPASPTCKTISCDGAGGCTTVNTSGSCGKCGTCSSGVCSGDCAGNATCCFPGCATPPAVCP